MVGYNVQTAVETKHHIIVAHDVTNTGSDRRQLSRMAIKAQAAMGKSKLTVIADRGYYQSEEILTCDEAGIMPCLPKPHTVPNPSKGLFDRSAFRYLPTQDVYRCPAGKRLTWRFQTVEHGLTLHGYVSSACTTYSLKAQCTTGQYRRIKRWEHEAVLDAMQRRLDRRPDAMRRRRETVEHPYGTIKSWMGSTHFLLKTLTKVRTEMSLHILAYNMKRVMNIFDIPSLVTAIRA